MATHHQDLIPDFATLSKNMPPVSDSRLGLSRSQFQFLIDLAKLSYGHGRKEAELGGKGIMLLDEREGKYRLIKCLTHGRDAERAQAEALKASGSEALKQGSRRLLEMMKRIASDLHIRKDVDFLYESNLAKSLVDRKIVAKFVRTVEAAKDVDLWHADGTDLKGYKSRRNMSYDTVVNTEGPDYDRYRLDASDVVGDDEEVQGAYALLEKDCPRLAKLKDTSGLEGLVSRFRNGVKKDVVPGLAHAPWQAVAESLHHIATTTFACQGKSREAWYCLVKGDFDGLAQFGFDSDIIRARFESDLKRLSLRRELLDVVTGLDGETGMAERLQRGLRVVADGLKQGAEFKDDLAAAETFLSFFKKEFATDGGGSFLARYVSAVKRHGNDNGVLKLKKDLDLTDQELEKLIERSVFGGEKVNPLDFVKQVCQTYATDFKCAFKEARLSAQRKNAYSNYLFEDPVEFSEFFAFAKPLGIPAGYLLGLSCGDGYREVVRDFASGSDNARKVEQKIRKGVLTLVRLCKQSKLFGDELVSQMTAAGSDRVRRRFFFDLNAKLLSWLGSDISDLKIEKTKGGAFSFSGVNRLCHEYVLLPPSEKLANKAVAACRSENPLMFKVRGLTEAALKADFENWLDGKLDEPEKDPDTVSLIRKAMSEDRGEADTFDALSRKFMSERYPDQFAVFKLLEKMKGNPALVRNKYLHPVKGSPFDWTLACTFGKIAIDELYAWASVHLESLDELIGIGKNDLGGAVTDRYRAWVKETKAQALATKVAYYKTMSERLPKMLEAVNEKWVKDPRLASAKPDKLGLEKFAADFCEGGRLVEYCAWYEGCDLEAELAKAAKVYDALVFSRLVRNRKLKCIREAQDVDAKTLGSEKIFDAHRYHIQGSETCYLVSVINALVSSQEGTDWLNSLFKDGVFEYFDPLDEFAGGKPERHFMRLDVLGKNPESIPMFEAAIGSIAGFSESTFSGGDVSRTAAVLGCRLEQIPKQDDCQWFDAVSKAVEEGQQCLLVYHEGGMSSWHVVQILRPYGNPRDLSGDWGFIVRDQGLANDPNRFIYTKSLYRFPGRFTAGKLIVPQAKVAERPDADGVGKDATMESMRRLIGVESDIASVKNNPNRIASLAMRLFRSGAFRDESPDKVRELFGEAFAQVCENLEWKNAARGFEAELKKALTVASVRKLLAQSGTPVKSGEKIDDLVMAVQEQIIKAVADVWYPYLRSKIGGRNGEQYFRSCVKRLEDELKARLKAVGSRFSDSVEPETWASDLAGRFLSSAADIETAITECRNTIGELRKPGGVLEQVGQVLDGMFAPDAMSPAMDCVKANYPEAFKTLTDKKWMKVIGAQLEPIRKQLESYGVSVSTGKTYGWLVALGVRRSEESLLNAAVGDFEALRKYLESVMNDALSELKRYVTAVVGRLTRDDLNASLGKALDRNHKVAQCEMALKGLAETAGTEDQELIKTFSGCLSFKAV